MIGRVALAAALCVCAGTAWASDFNRAAAARIAHIVVVGPGERDHVPIRDPDIVESNSPELGNRLAAWLTGGKTMTDARMDSSMAGLDLDRILEARHVQLGAELNADVTAALARDGYAIQSEAGFNTDASINLSAQRLRYNGLAYHGHITPEIIVDVSVADMNSHEVLFDRTYSLTDTDATVIGGRELAPDPNYVFTSYNDVVNDPERAVAGLRASLDAIAQAIAADLAR
ncbi:MAG TPA: hypothetical protein VN932_06590 [Rhizomicrobium sp.]|nr:hypothetical protein [Rhizomicrobium sp.]